MAKRRHSNRRHRGSFGFLYKLLSVLVICGCIVAALTLFFRVTTVEITGQQRYTDEEVLAASGIEQGDNLLLLNKYDAANSIVSALPYIERIRIDRTLPSTLTIEVQECSDPLAILQDGSAWIISSSGRIVDQKGESAAESYGVISGCQLLAPSVGTQIALSTEYAAQQQSLLDLMAALSEAGMLSKVDGIRLDDISAIRMDYIGRFTVKMPYGADYEMKLKILREALAQDVVQDNMTGTFDMMRDDNRVFLDQSTR